MSRVKKFFLLTFFAFSTCAWALSEKQTISVEKAPLYTDSNSKSRLIGYLKRSTVVEIVNDIDFQPWVQVRVARVNKPNVLGFVRQSDFSSDKVDLATASPVASQEHAAVQRPWSFGAGFSGYSAAGSTQVTVSAEVRYLWTFWLESLGGVDFGFGSKFLLGARVGQRLYVPVSETLRPYVQLGYRFNLVGGANALALEMGGGLQFIRGGGSYFDIGLVYIYASPFNSSATNALTFGGSSGWRF